MEQKFKQRLETNCDMSDLPNSITPTFNYRAKCRHGESYDHDDNHLVLIASKTIIYCEEQDKEKEIPVYGRRTVGDCRCVQQADTSDLLLMNMGSGEFVDYVFLDRHLMARSDFGRTMSEEVLSRQRTLKNWNKTTKLTYELFRSAFDGYSALIKFQPDTWLCPNCGDSPSMIVADAKCVGPSRRKVKHITEFNAVENDNILEQGSFLKDRVFLSSQKERKKLQSLLSEKITGNEFLNSRDVTSENGILVKDLVRRLFTTYDEIPGSYVSFLSNISKACSVAGYVQVTCEEPLEILKSFCNHTDDIRTGNAENVRKLDKLKKELPAMWGNLCAIANLEGSNFLPGDISDITLKLIDIRQNTFLNARQRFSDDYVDHDGTEEPTQCYPAFNIFRYPKKYEINNRSDTDRCEKNYPQGSDFANGVFSIGCGCAVGITYGWELMLTGESSRNLFRFLMTR